MTARPAHQPAAWDGSTLALAIAADRVIVGPEAAQVLVSLIDYLAKAEKTPLSPYLQRIREVLRVISGPTGQADVRDPDEEPASIHDPISTTEAAVLLGCSREHANRMARDGVLGATQLVGNRRVISRVGVTAQASLRRADPTPPQETV